MDSGHALAIDVITTTGGVTVDTDVTDTDGDQTTYTITFTPTGETFSLTLAAGSVADLAGLTGPATTHVTASGTATGTVATVNQPPVANAGDDAEKWTTGTEVTLTGTGSSDSDGTIQSYAWTHTSTDGDTPATVIPLTNAATDTATFTAPATAAVLIFTLTVTDDSGDSATNTDSDTVTITVTAPVANTAPVIAIENAAVDYAENTDPAVTPAVATYTATGCRER